jgi:hypothetical protein
MSDFAWVTLENGRERYCRVRFPETARGDFPTPRIAGDNIEVVSQVDGKVFTSKSALRRQYRENGYIEIGNEDVTRHIKPPAKDRAPIKEAVGKALSRVGIPTG